MDPLSAEFAKLRMIDTIRECNDLEELKILCKSLIDCHFASKQLLGALMLEGLPKL